jgi:hypothetical protein
MIWSTCSDKYEQCIASSDNGSITGNWKFLDPLFTDDGGHGMIFKDDENIYLTFHSPNKSLYERPKFVKIQDNGNCLEIK